MQKKSQGVSFMLTFVFGPIGILYSSVNSALVMIAVYIVIFLMAIAVNDFGMGLYIAIFIASLASIIVGVLAVTSYNENVEVEEKKQKEMQEEMIKNAIEENKQKEFIQKLMIEEEVQARLKEIDREKKQHDVSEPLPGWINDGLPLENEMKN